MAGYGSFYPSVDDEAMDYNKRYDPAEVFKNFTNANSMKAAKQVRSVGTGEVIIETRKKRSFVKPT